jgi:hypothetical protein
MVVGRSAALGRLGYTTQPKRYSISQSRGGGGGAGAQALKNLYTVFELVILGGGLSPDVRCQMPRRQMPRCRSQMPDAVQHGDLGQMPRLISQMSAVTDKRFAGLASVLDVILSDVGGSDVD